MMRKRERGDELCAFVQRDARVGIETSTGGRGASRFTFPAKVAFLSLLPLADDRLKDVMIRDNVYIVKARRIMLLVYVGKRHTSEGGDEKKDKEETAMMGVGGGKPRQTRTWRIESRRGTETDERV